jgi:hypothetical protein
MRPRRRTAIHRSPLTHPRAIATVRLPRRRPRSMFSQATPSFNSSCEICEIAPAPDEYPQTLVARHSLHLAACSLPRHLRAKCPPCPHLVAAPQLRAILLASTSVYLRPIPPITAFNIDRCATTMLRGRRALRSFNGLQSSYPTENSSIARSCVRGLAKGKWYTTACRRISLRRVWAALCA